MAPAGAEMLRMEPAEIWPPARLNEGARVNWLEPSFERAFGPAAADEGAALASRAPVDSL